MIKAQILVVEDQAATADLILEVLKGEGYEAQTVDTLAKARARMKKQPPELVILDRNLPDGDGVDLLAEIRDDEKLGALPVIILTAKKDIADKVSGLRTGADDYVAKPFNTEELVARVAAILRRAGKGEEPATVEAGGIKLDRTSRKVHIGEKEVPLSAKEFDLLWFLVYRKNRVLTRDFLLQHVWGYDSGIDLTTKVIDVTLSHLRNKIGAVADKIVAVRGFGYRFDA
ncbi:MAG: DNA-binding response regulator [Elusimicrobia bacterium CG11_big_fil_rev_8_21_14_0_20_64_6]|nr:MAG: DNA-binding response regulator [Elusimicrobia bacterium CG11_big_fil_rev_8_21_14_0_20_64_6]